ncbi:MAG: hypothetical protein DRH07_09400 [Deltaproteobacteria bacterium]|nr:MAG: hypothetical protein DRH07_09400 [Deltaproteobacteria bacterium]
MPKINICICTYQRPKLLTDCLQSLASIVVPSETEVTVTVIDNDQTGSAEATVTGLTETFPFNIYYHCEDKRGIPCARNRAVEETHRLGSDYLVFIDDDEWVEPLWLDKLYAYCQNQGGDIVVSGDVIPELPDKTPEYMRPFFNQKQHPTGTLLGFCATNNVLSPIYLTKDLGLRFDESHPLAGGSDRRFFYEAVKAGVKIKKCAEALVHESVPENRATLRWLSKRKFKGGTTIGWEEKQNGRSTLGIIYSAGRKLIIELFLAGIMFLVGNKYKQNKRWLKACRHLGVLSGAFGLRVDSYKSVDGQ